MNNKIGLSVVLRIVVAVLLFLALYKQGYGYYQILRWIISGISIYCIYLAYTQKKIAWVWVFGGTAVLFNPLAPIFMDRVAWAIIDVVIAVLIVISIFYVRENARLDK
jgi:hypothetical protein